MYKCSKCGKQVNKVGTQLVKTCNCVEGSIYAVMEAKLKGVGGLESGNR